STKTVTYIVQGGSPRLRARIRALQYAENEVTLVEQLQQLKMDYVANERLLEGLRTSGPVVNRSFPGRESSIQRALADTLAEIATPGAALRLIDLLEQAETEVERELQKLPTEQRDKLLKQLQGMDQPPAGSRAAPAGPPARGPAVPPSKLDTEQRPPFSAFTVVPKQPPGPAPAVTSPLPALLRAGSFQPQNRSAGSDPAWLAFDKARAAFEQARADLDRERQAFQRQIRRS